MPQNKDDKVEIYYVELNNVKEKCQLQKGEIYAKIILNLDYIKAITKLQNKHKEEMLEKQQTTDKAFRHQLRLVKELKIDRDCFKKGYKEVSEERNKLKQQLQSCKKEIEKIYKVCNDERVWEIQNKLGDLLKHLEGK